MNLYAIMSNTGEIFGFTTSEEGVSAGLESLNSPSILAGFPYSLVMLSASVTVVRQGNSGPGETAPENPIEVGPVEPLPEPEPTPEAFHGD